MGLHYETFVDGAEIAIPPGPSPEWSLGHDAGLAEGLSEGVRRGSDEATARAGALSAEMTQSLGDMAFGYAEAREQVLASLGPLFRVVIDRLLPAMAAEALGSWLVPAILDAAREDSAAPLLIHVHPDRIDALRACLPLGGPADLRPDAALGPHDARLAQSGRETALDLGACLQALGGTLSAILDDQARKARHA